ncbi:hypothetical protein TNCT_100381 [Trichonephila clavata]|uniref:Transposase n=1 Tax=Trichonephila clavata TaxID=2740835 RepID=A0A8X6HJ92_TRICU|nr:hypothetical protein TNCT_100381 [Trichonephila clavata]
MKKKPAVFQWHKRFRKGHTNIDDLGSGCLFSSTPNENAEQIREIVCEDRRITIAVIPSELGIADCSIRSILQDDLKLNIIFDCLHMIPRNVIT